MEPNLDQDRRQAHALLDALPAETLSAVRSLLEVMVEPLARSLPLARVEEEVLTPLRWTAPVLHSLAERASRTTKSSANSV
jgi:hypothetical protein